MIEDMNDRRNDRDTSYCTGLDKSRNVILRFLDRESCVLCHQHAQGQQKCDRRHEGKAEGTCNPLTRQVEGKRVIILSKQKAKLLSHSFPITKST